MNRLNILFFANSNKTWIINLKNVFEAKFKDFLNILKAAQQFTMKSNQFINKKLYLISSLNPNIS